MTTTITRTVESGHLDDAVRSRAHALAPARALSQSVDDELRDLRIDGYDVVFVQRVTLLPVEIDERATERERSAPSGNGAGHG